MKKILTLTIAAFAMASAVFAQTEKEMAALETKANAAVDKVAASSRSLHWLILTRKRLTSSVLLSRTV